MAKVWIRSLTISDLINNLKSPKRRNHSSPSILTPNKRAPSLSPQF